MLSQYAAESLPMSSSLLIALCGVAIVMLELIVIALMILLMAKILGNVAGKKAVATAPAATPVADNSADEIQAVIMATISEDLEIPIQELNFKSIKPQ